MNAYVKNAYVKVPDEIRFSSILANQREAFLREGAPTLAKRRADLLKLKNAILARRKEYETAINADFGHRPANHAHGPGNRLSPEEPAALDAAAQPPCGDAVPTGNRQGSLPAAGRHRHPIAVELSRRAVPHALATAIAAGNRAIVKPSEFTPKTSALMAAILSEIFSEEEVAVVTGGSDFPTKGV